MKTTAIALSLALFQSAGSGRASLQGTVVALETAAPVSSARVVLAKIGGQVADYRTGTTDENGRFVFRDLSGGTYRVYANRQGYLQGEHGRRTAGVTGVPVSVVEGQAAPPVLITLIPTGVITGRVLENGKPIRDVMVDAWRASYRDGERTLTRVEYARSDDLGEYRLFGLAPGRYFVSALPQDRPRIQGDTYIVPQIPSNANNNQWEVRTPAREALNAGIIAPEAYDRGMFLPVFYPGVTDSDAALAIDLSAGMARTGIDLTTAHTPTASVGGHVTNSVTGGPSDGVSISVAARPGQTVGIPGATVRNGVFELPSVPAGKYELVARTNIVGAPRLFGTASIDVGSQGLDNVEIVLRPGTTITGHVAVDGAPAGFPERDRSVLLVQLVAASPGGPGAVPVRADGTFSIENVESRDYRLRVLYGRTIPATTARFGTENVLDAPIRVSADTQGQQLDITVSLRTGTVDALVVDGSGRPVAGITAALVPDPPRRNRSELYRTATTNAFGQMHLDDVIPGDYKVFAADVETGEWQDPDVIRLHESRGQRVQVRGDGRHNVTLRVTP